MVTNPPHEYIAVAMVVIVPKQSFSDRPLQFRTPRAQVTECRIWLGMLLAAAVVSSLFNNVALAENTTGLKGAVILVIRHAEKPTNGAGLSPMGEARSEAYVKYFEDFKIDGQRLNLNYLFASRDSQKSQRARLTIERIGRDLNLKVDDQFSSKQFSMMVDDIRTFPDGSKTLIVWHHGTIPGLLSALGADPEKILPDGKWPHGEFGWIIQLRYDQNGALLNSTVIKENLRPD